MLYITYIFLSRKSGIGLNNLGSVYFDQQVIYMLHIYNVLYTIYIYIYILEPQEQHRPQQSRLRLF